MKKIILALIRFYRRGISPMKKPCCKYYPTCSAYALEAVERFGALRGTAMALYRVLRCNPFSRGGYDPVPEKKSGENKSGFFPGVPGGESRGLPYGKGGGRKKPPEMSCKKEELRNK